MKIVVRGITEEMLKDEVKAIIREYCEYESVYAKAELSKKGNLKGVEIYPTGSKAMIGYIAYDVTSREPKYYTVVKRRRVVKTYALRNGVMNNEKYNTFE